ncbi:hypothetical protein P5706_33910 [Pseudomonas sp. ChxA]|uniref:hypothetical protein n=1 Tax=Pseudomonas sp. ChxA TaxID=3035473 RepID=UPI0025524C78|nr:hypothetical protein [Pseudomonas sp. ChxA]MDL2189171.1 hypothetical protein [Pseudomonas sp. ChxA]
MGRRNVETSASVVGSPDENLPSEGRATRDRLAEIVVSGLSAEAPVLSGEDAKVLRQTANAVEKRLRELSGEIASAPFVQNGDTRKKPESNTVNNPANIVWRGLMLDP